MVAYDFKKGKARIEEILDKELKVVELESEEIPADDSLFTFDNAYYGWVSAVFVDIRNSTSLFVNENKEMMAKIIRCFTSEIIEILREDINLREIGIRGDCVYAVYTTPTKDAIYEVADKTFFINTYMKMLNELLMSRGLDLIRVGIGMSTSRELVVKAGRKGVGINSKVWIGRAVTKASKYSSLGNKAGNNVMVYSSCSYINFIDKLVDNNKDKKPKDWFAIKYLDNEKLYTANIIQVNFNQWIDDGMK